MKRWVSMVLMMAALLSGIVFSLPVSAITYHPRMDEAQWIARTSSLQCRLIQPIPFFGRAVFEQSAGQSLRFYLQALSNPLDKGQGSLHVNAPRWHPELPGSDLGLVGIEAGEYPVELDDALATRLLAELFKGKSPEFSRRSWYGDDESVAVALSSVSFRAAYTHYRHCLAELLPIGFDQLQRSKVQFASDEYSLDDKARTLLDIVARYAIADTELDQIFIDGHTDSTHTRPYNTELSKKRAEAVSTYLVARGVSANLISLRYHGERFPLQTNRSEDGKAANRRVTIKLERILPQFSRRFPTH